MIVALCAVSAALVVVAVMWWRTSTRSLLAAHTRKTVIVTLKTSESFKGVLYATAPDALVLRDVTALAVGAEAQHLPVDGELMLLRDDVAYLQFP